MDQHALEYSPSSPTALIAFEESLPNYDAYWPSLDELPDVDEQPQVALMADLPEEVVPVLCTPECVKKVELYADHIDDLIKKVKQIEYEKKDWGKEKKVFEDKIKSLMVDVEKLKSEKIILQNKYDETFEKLTKSEADLSAACIRVDDFVLSSKSLQTILDRKINSKLNTGLGYHSVEPPSNYTAMPESVTVMPLPVNDASESSSSASKDSQETLEPQLKPFIEIDTSIKEENTKVSSQEIIPFVSKTATIKSILKGNHQETFVDEAQQKAQENLESLLKNAFASSSSHMFPLSSNVDQDGSPLKKKKRRSRKKKTAVLVSSAQMNNLNPASNAADTFHVPKVNQTPVECTQKGPFKPFCDICKKTNHATHLCYFYDPSLHGPKLMSSSQNQQNPFSVRSKGTQPFHP